MIKGTVYIQDKITFFYLVGLGMIGAITEKHEIKPNSDNDIFWVDGEEHIYRSAQNAKSFSDATLVDQNYIHSNRAFWIVDRKGITVPQLTI